jgi:ADP-heptose:LPS heptosyltransferase
VILEYPPALANLFRCLEGVDEGMVHGSDEGTPRSDYDRQVGLLSLPLRFATDLETIPSTTPYLTADPARVEAWRQRLEADGPGLRVGLVWAGSRGHVNDVHRSLSLREYAPLAQVARVRLYSLQTGAAAAEAASPPAGMSLIDLSSCLDDFADTAAAMMNLDLVITVDTAAAHLAGALGKPVWTLLPCNADWRWLREREDSPWYPTMRLFRQTQSGNWEAVLERVCGALRERADAGV